MKGRVTQAVVAIFAFAIMYFAIGFLFVTDTGGEKLYHQISVEQAEQLVENRNLHLANNTLINVDGEKFKMDEVELLSQLNGVEYLYIERAAHNDGTETSILWGMTKDNKKIASIILERSWPCPPNCWEQLVTTN